MGQQTQAISGQLTVGFAAATCARIVVCVGAYSGRDRTRARSQRWTGQRIRHATHHARDSTRDTCQLVRLKIDHHLFPKLED